jgi:NAD(P)H-dependent flavin oxidoreductase YrpB (nitropropane dioxygenase family)
MIEILANEHSVDHGIASGKSRTHDVGEIGRRHAIVSLEAETHPAVKQKFLDATSADTIRSRSMTGKHARMLKTKWTEEWERPDTPDPLGMPLQPILTNEAQQRINRAANTVGSGANELAGYFVGQIVGTMIRPKTSGQVVMEMVEEFIESVEALAAQLQT